jgi:hypothetical protein
MSSTWRNLRLGDPLLRHSRHPVLPQLLHGSLEYTRMDICEPHLDAPGLRCARHPDQRQNRFHLRDRTGSSPSHLTRDNDLRLCGFTNSSQTNGPTPTTKTSYCSDSLRHD